MFHRAAGKLKKTLAAGVDRRSEESCASQRDGDSAAPPSPDRDTAASDAGQVHFREVDLDPRVLRAILDDLKFDTLTPIQAQALPPALSGVDVGGRAQTGTGKTAAFLIAILQRFLAAPSGRKPHQPLALVLAPTRELAVQIDRDAAALAKYCDARNLAVFGGVEYDQQRRQISKGVDLVTATPGRLIDYLNSGTIDLSKASILVIDEADRMLDMGFIPDVRRIIARLPSTAHRQTMLFSATLSPDILRLTQRWMRDPVMVEVSPEQVIAEGVQELVYAVSSKEKLALLLWMLEHETSNRVLIFRNRRRDAEALHTHLSRYGIDCALLTGDVPQKRRQRVLDGFRAGQVRVIVATDVAGRGIHVEAISHVVNYDLPYEAEDYVHRIGRTGRAGETGLAVSFACEERSFVVPEIEEFTKRELSIRHPDPEMLVLPPVTHRSPARSGHKDIVPRTSSPRRRSSGRGQRRRR